MKIKSLLISLLAILTFSSCGAKQSENNNDNDMDKNNNNSKTLVVFFSHAGDNYGVGNIKEGNTKIVAEIINKKLDADLLEIVCVKDYDMSYDALCNLAKKEQQTGELPGFTLLLNNSKVEGKIDLNAYNNVYIGGPVWWGTYPQVMFSFFKEYDLNGKTLHPFTTHEGSGLGNCVKDLEKTYPKATFSKAFSIYGHEVRTEEGKIKIEDWIR